MCNWTIISASDTNTKIAVPSNYGLKNMEPSNNDDIPALTGNQNNNGSINKR